MVMRLTIMQRVYVILFLATSLYACSGSATTDTKQNMLDEKKRMNRVVSHYVSSKAVKSLAPRRSVRDVKKADGPEDEEMAEARAWWTKRLTMMRRTVPQIGDMLLPLKVDVLEQEEEANALEQEEALEETTADKELWLLNTLP